MNDITTSTIQADVMSAVRTGAMLADVTIATWSGMRTDQERVRELKLTHNATGDVGRMVKNTMAGADQLLRDARNAFTAVRTRHYQLTLPWVGDPHATRREGPRLLPVALVSTYFSELGKLKATAVERLEMFLADYPRLKAEAMKNLGTMADSHYPDPDEVRAAFRVHIDVEPIPETTSFQGLDGKMFDILARNLARKQQRQWDEAIGEVWTRISEPVHNLLKQLENTDNKQFKAPAVENVRKLLAVIPGWNLGRDPQLDEIKQDLESLVAGVNASDIRKDQNVRDDVARRAREVVAKLKGWGK